MNETTYPTNTPTSANRGNIIIVTLICGGLFFFIITASIIAIIATADKKEVPSYQAEKLQTASNKNKNKNKKGVFVIDKDTPSYVKGEYAVPSSPSTERSARGFGGFEEEAEAKSSNSESNTDTSSYALQSNGNVPTSSEPTSYQAGSSYNIEVNGVNFQFRWIPSGSFTMGSSGPERAEALRQAEAYGSKWNYSNEREHNVKVEGFFLLETEVTQEMWTAVKGNNNNPSHFRGERRPVEQVSWHNCQQYIDELNALVVYQEWSFAIPTEEQWEYACRGGTLTAFYFGGSLNGTQANCKGNYPFPSGDISSRYLGTTAEVGSYDAYKHPWGLKDMHGNVWEWCKDYGGRADNQDRAKGSSGLSESHIIRGGSWDSAAVHCRSARIAAACQGSDCIGFRIALVKKTSRRY